MASGMLRKPARTAGHTVGHAAHGNNPRSANVLWV